MAQRKISSSRLSRNSSRCASVERLDIVDEEEEVPFRHFINKQEVLAEDETEESDSDEKNEIQRKISYEDQHNGSISRDSRNMSLIDSKLPSRKTSAMNSAANSQAPSRRWSRHSSPTRGEILRMDDEMHTVNRGGIEMTIPLNITHHIPPRLIGQLDEEGIMICDRMLQQGYSVQEIVEYFKTYVPTKERIARKFREFQELTAKLKCGDVSESEKLRMMKDIMQGQNLSEKDFLDLMGTQFGDKTKAEMEEMLKSGKTMEEVLEHFQRQAEKEELKNKLQALLDDQNATTEDIFNSLRSQLGAEDQAKVDEMLKRGLTMDQIINHFMNGGMDEGSSNEIPTKEEMNKKMRENLKSKLQNLINDPNATTEDVFKAMRNNLSKEEQAKIDEMLKLGMSMDEIVKHFMSGGMDDDKEAKQKAKEELKTKLKELMNDPNASTEDVFNVMKSQLGAEDQKKIEEMLKKGMTMDQIINHFMKGGMDEVQEETDFTKKMKELIGGKNLSEEEMLELMKSQLGEGSKAELEAMLAQGFSLQEVMDHFMKHGKTDEEEQRELQEKLEKMMNDPNANSEDVFNALRNQLGAADQAKIDELLKSGMTMDQIVKQFMEGGMENVKDDIKAKLENMINDPNASTEDVFKALRNQLGAADQAKIDELLKSGMTMDQIVKQFMEGGMANVKLEEESDFSKKMKELSGGKNLTQDEMLELMKSQLGSGSKAELEAMLAKGYSIQEAMDYMMKHGKTEEEEQKAEADKIRSVLEKDMSNMSNEEKLNFLKENLSDQAKAAMEDLLAQGYTMDEIIDLFKKHGNNLNAIDEELSNPNVVFDDEPPDAHLYANRDVFTVINKDTIKSEVPYMSPSIKNLTFKQFIDKIQELVKGKGLTHREILDIMEFRMGGVYLQELKELRQNGATLQEVVEYFLKKDAAMRQSARRKARLEAQAKVDAWVDLKRKFVKSNWGVEISYTFSDEYGLHLVLGHVSEESPAYASGVRSGDVIVKVNDWLITVMDRPQVAVHLFQAGANIVKLGIIKPNGKPHDIISFANGQDHSSNLIGVY